MDKIKLTAGLVVMGQNSFVTNIKWIKFKQRAKVYCQAGLAKCSINQDLKRLPMTKIVAKKTQNFSDLFLSLDFHFRDSEEAAIKT